MSLATNMGDDVSGPVPGTFSSLSDDHDRLQKLCLEQTQLIREQAQRIAELEESKKNTWEISREQMETILPMWDATTSKIKKEIAATFAKRFFEAEKLCQDHDDALAAVERKCKMALGFAQLPEVYSYSGRHAVAKVIEKIKEAIAAAERIVK